MHLRLSAVIYHTSEPQALGSVGAWEGRIKPDIKAAHAPVCGTDPTTCVWTNWEGKLHFPEPSGKEAIVTLSQ